MSMTGRRNSDRAVPKQSHRAVNHDAAVPQELGQRLVVGLAMIAGFVDAYGIITYNTYLSFMSGNNTQAGYELGQHNFRAAAYVALAIVSFVSGTCAGALLAESWVHRKRRLVFGVIAASLALI